MGQPSRVVMSGATAADVETCCLPSCSMLQRGCMYSGRGG